MPNYAQRIGTTPKCFQYDIHINKVLLAVNLDAKLYVALIRGTRINRPQISRIKKEIPHSATTKIH